MTDTNIFQTLSREYYNFTASEKRIADYILSSGAQSQSMSISELAEVSGVAVATISRFCRRVGCPSYSAFKLAIAASSASRIALENPLTGETSQDDTIPGMADKLANASVEAIWETRSLLDPDAIRMAADVLLRSNMVLCMGQGGSMLIADEAAHLFSTSFSGYFPVMDSHMQSIYASQLTEHDAILYFSYSGTTTGLMDVLSIAKAQKAKVILVTRYPNSPGAMQSDIVLECGSRESPLQLGSVPARVAQLYLIDTLFSEMSRRDLDGCKKRRAKVADALSDKHI